MRVRHVIAVLLLVVPVFAWERPANAGAASEEAQFLAMINQLRVDNGLPPLTVHGELTAQAQHWAAVMAADDHLRHASDLSEGISADWSVLGENVGHHSVPNVGQLFQAFRNSPAHLANLVDPRFEYVGVGVVYDEAGGIWTTHRFMALRTSSVTAAPPTTTTQPPTTQPQTTQPQPVDRLDPTEPPTTAQRTTTEPPTSPPSADRLDRTTGPLTTPPPTTQPQPVDRLDPTGSPSTKPPSVDRLDPTTQPSTPAQTSPPLDPEAITLFDAGLETSSPAPSADRSSSIRALLSGESPVQPPPTTRPDDQPKLDRLLLSAMLIELDAAGL